MSTSTYFHPAPRPWQFDWFRGRPAIVDANGQPVAFVESTRGKFELEKVNAEHASLCVNAHEGLLEALQEIARNDPAGQSSAGIIARAAIARATGEQS